MKSAFDYDAIIDVLSELGKRNMTIERELEELVVMSDHPISREDRLLRELAVHKEAFLLLLKESNVGSRQELMAPQNTYYELSFKEKSKVFLYQIMAKSKSPKIDREVRAFNMSTEIYLDRYEPDAFEEALRRLILHHDNLRTTFRKVDGSWKKHIQELSELSPLIYFEDLRGGTDPWKVLEEKKDREFKKLTFEFTASKLWKLSLFQTDETGYVVVFVINHVLADERSVSVLEEDFAKIYTSLIEDKTYSLDTSLAGKFTGERETRLSNEKIWLEAEQFWLTNLSEKVPCYYLEDLYRVTNYSKTVSYREKLKEEVQTNFQGVADDEIENLVGCVHRATTIDGKTFRTVVHGDNFLELVVIAQKWGTTINNILMANYFLTLYSLTGKKDMILGLDRSLGELGLSRTVGWLVHTILVRIEFDGKKSVEAFVNQVQEQMVKANAHNIYPIEKVLEKTDLALDAIGALYLNFLYSEGVNELSDFSSYHTEVEAPSYFDLDCFIKNYSNAIEIFCRYKSTLFEKESVEDIFSKFHENLNKLVGANAQDIDKLFLHQKE